jgi:hypothetical protein
MWESSYLQINKNQWEKFINQVSNCKKKIVYNVGLIIYGDQIFSSSMY